MPQQPAEPSDLVMTQAELPPGIDAPSPPDVRKEIAGDRTADPSPPVELVREIKQLADRVGGIDRLRELVDLIARMPH